MAKATRRCADCRADISQRGNKSVRCRDCQAKRRYGLYYEVQDRPPCVDDDGTCTAGRLKRGRCSRHYYTARRDSGGHLPQQPRPCAVCEVVFTPTRSDALCCSGRCNWRRQGRTRLVDHPDRRCRTCGDPFKPKSTLQRRCRPDCTTDAAVLAAVRWRLANRHAMSEHGIRRRTAQREHPDSVPVSERDWMRLVHRHGGRCAYCGEKPDRLTKDHVVPIARGGRHGIANLLPACVPCNSRKRDRLLVEYRIWLIAFPASKARLVRTDRWAGGRRDAPRPASYEQLALPVGDRREAV